MAQSLMRPIVVAVVALFQGAVSLPILSAQTIDSHKTITLTLPTEWVPFSADVRHTSDTHVTTGKFHRRRDGSTAHYLETPGGVAITIHNVQTRQTYIKLGDRDWVARPIEETRLPNPFASCVCRRDKCRCFTMPCWARSTSSPTLAHVAV